MVKLTKDEKKVMKILREQRLGIAVSSFKEDYNIKHARKAIKGLVEKGKVYKQKSPYSGYTIVYIYKKKKPGYWG